MKKNKLMESLPELIGALIGALILAILGGFFLSLSFEQLSFFQGMGVVAAIGFAVRIGN